MFQLLWNLQQCLKRNRKINGFESYPDAKHCRTAESPPFIRAGSFNANKMNNSVMLIYQGDTNHAPEGDPITKHKGLITYLAAKPGNTSAAIS